MRLGAVLAAMFLAVSCAMGALSASREGQASAKPEAYVVEKVRYRSDADGAILAGTLTMPVGETRFPAVLLLSGAGLQDRDQTIYGHKPFKVLADYLTRQGIAVLRVDDRGVGESTRDLLGQMPETLAQDALSGVGYLKHRKDFAASAIGLIGHSEGAQVATIAACSSEDVDFVVMLGALGLPWPENNQLAQKEMLKRLGKSDSIISAALELNSRIYSVVRQGHGPQTTEDMLCQVIADWRDSLVGEVKREFDTFTSEHPDHWDWLADQFAEPPYQYYMATDPRRFIERLECPVLALCGENDIQVLPGANLGAIEATFKVSGHTDYEVRELPGLNHLFQACETGLMSEYAKIDETFSEHAMSLVYTWISKRFDVRGTGEIEDEDKAAP